MAVQSQMKILPIYENVAKVPKSARVIFELLQHEGSLKPDSISQKTLLSARTVRYALKKLMEKNLISRNPDLNDLRSHYYFLS